MFESFTPAKFIPVIVLVALFWWILNIFSFHRTLCGRVFTTLGEPVVDAIVKITTGKDTILANTNSSGLFVCPKPNVDKFRLQIYKEGYDTISFIVPHIIPNIIVELE